MIRSTIFLGKAVFTEDCFDFNNFLMKSLVRRTNVESTVDKHSYQIYFVLVRCETGKIRIKPSECSPPPPHIKAGGKTVRSSPNKNIQKWQCVVFLDLESEFDIWVKTVDMVKKPVNIVSPIK